MTEKRFSILSSYLELYTVFDDKNFEPLSSNEVIDLMNNFNEENEQLKERLKLVRKDLTHIMLLLLNDEIVKQLSDYDIKVFERLSKV